MDIISSIIFSITFFFASFIFVDSFGLKKLSISCTSIIKLSNPFENSRVRSLLSSSGRISFMTKVAWSSSRSPDSILIMLQRSLIAMASSSVLFAELTTIGIVSFHSFCEFFLASSICFFCSFKASLNSFFASSAIFTDSSFATSDDLESKSFLNFLES